MSDWNRYYLHDQNYESACPLCGNDSTGGRLCFSCDRQQQIDNYDMSDWILCPKCDSYLVIQHDWRKPIYECEMCHHVFVDPNKKEIDSDY